MIDLTSYICLIENAADDSFGTGFCVHRDRGVTYVVTCAHVISKAEPEQIKVEGASVQRISTGEGLIDLAVLEVMGLEEKPLLQQVGLGQSERLIQIPGIWEPHRSTLVKRTLDGQLMKAIRLKSASVLDWVEAWDLNIVGEGYELRGGYSGSPVIDVETGDVIGVTSHRASQGYKGIAIAIQALAEIWKDIPASLLLQKQPLIEEPEMNQFKQTSTRQLSFQHQQLNHQIVVKNIEIETLKEKVLGITEDLEKVEEFTSLYRSLKKQKQSHQSELILLRAEQERLMAALEDITQELKKRGHQLEN